MTILGPDHGGSACAAVPAGSLPGTTGVAAGPALPGLQSAWLSLLTGVQDPPSEPRATCGDCVMCGDVERSGSRVTFSADVKCCSYIPNLANFLTGRSLAGPGRWSVVERIERRAGVTPLGLGLSTADIRRLVGAQSQFGQADVVLCPHFDRESRGCAIWQTRNAVCATWFCKHERGAVGLRFWHAVRDLLIAAEERVAIHCLGQGGLPDEQVRAVLGHRLETRRTLRAASSGAGPAGDTQDEHPQWYSRMWGAWQGREEEWFARCAESMAAIDDGELAGWMDGARHLIEDVNRRRADLDGHDLPDRLRYVPGAGSETTADVLRLIGYSPFDPLVLPARLRAGLHHLDGRPLPDVLADLEQGNDVGLDADLLRRLHDFGVAVAPES